MKDADACPAPRTARPRTIPAVPALSDLPDALKVEELAAVLRISLNLAYEAVRTRLIRSIRIGGRIIVPKVAVTEYLNGTSHPEATPAQRRSA
jgi:excisionase family DNA binding protein